MTVLNQVIGSAVSFGLSLYLLKTLTIEQFGLYGLGFASVLLASGVGNALIHTQLVVLLPAKSAVTSARFAADLFIGMLLLCVASLMTMELGLGLLRLFSRTIEKHASMIHAVAFTSVAYVSRDFLTRLAYATRLEWRALVQTICYAISLALSLALVRALIPKTTPEAALWVQFSALIAATLVGIFLSRVRVDLVSIASVRMSLREALYGGKWALGGTVVTWLQTQSYVYITAAILGHAGVGLLNTARMFVLPLMSLLPAFDQLALPRLAEARARGDHASVRSVARYATLLVLLVLTYVTTTALVLWHLHPLASLNHGSGLHTLVWAWFAALMCQVLRTSASVGLQAALEFRGLLLDNLVSAIATVSLATILTLKAGPLGAIASLAAGDLLLALLFWRRIQSRDASAR